MTRMTEENPARIATVTDFDSHSYPVMYLVIANATEDSRPGDLKSSTVATPLNTYDNNTYSSVQTTSDPRLPIGLSRFALLCLTARAVAAHCPIQDDDTI